MTRHRGIWLLVLRVDILLTITIPLDLLIRSSSIQITLNTWFYVNLGCCSLWANNSLTVFLKALPLAHSILYNPLGCTNPPWWLVCLPCPWPSLPGLACMPLSFLAHPFCYIYWLPVASLSPKVMPRHHDVSSETWRQIWLLYWVVNWLLYWDLHY